MTILNTIISTIITIISTIIFCILFASETDLMRIMACLKNLKEKYQEKNK